MSFDELLTDSQNTPTEELTANRDQETSSADAPPVAPVRRRRTQNTGTDAASATPTISTTKPRATRTRKTTEPQKPVETDNVGLEIRQSISESQQNENFSTPEATSISDVTLPATPTRQRNTRNTRKKQEPTPTPEPTVVIERVKAETSGTAEATPTKTAKTATTRPKRQTRSNTKPISAPALETAEVFGMSLVGFLKNNKANVYCHAKRIGE